MTPGKVGRNDLCPCGSGKKFKHCHIDVVRSVDAIRALRDVPPGLPADRLHAQFVDLDNRLRIEVSNDVLFNQIRRDCPRIAEQFDELCASELRALNDDIVRVTAIFAAVTSQPTPEDERRELYTACIPLLLNAVQTLIAALDLFRRGFRLQPGMLLRNLIEILSTICHVVIERDDLSKLLAGQLVSTRTIATAKAVFPPIGQIYGLLSDTFTHVGSLHVSTSGENVIGEYRGDEEAFQLNWNFLHTAGLMVNVVAELAFFDSLSGHRYFRKVGPAFVYFPTDAERERLARLIK